MATISSISDYNHGCSDNATSAAKRIEVIRVMETIRVIEVIRVIQEIKVITWDSFDS